MNMPPQGLGGGGALLAENVLVMQPPRACAGGGADLWVSGHFGLELRNAGKCRPTKGGLPHLNAP